MYLIPPLFFMGLFFWFWKTHKGLDLCTYMTSLYVVNTLFSVYIIAMELLGSGGILFTNADAVFGIVPSMLFCLSIGIVLFPFSLIHVREIKQITIRAPWAVDTLSLVLVALSFVNLYLVVDSMFDILSGDLGQLRQEHYAGAPSPAQLKAETLPFIVRFFFYFQQSTILGLPIFFYNVCFRKKPWWWNGALLFASLTCPIAGIQVADRTEFVFYGIMALYCVVMFHHFFTQKLKRRLIMVCIPIAVLGVVYVTAVSASRFDENSGTSPMERNIQYTGQAYANFCYFYENAQPDLYSAERELPMFHHFIKHRDSTPERRAQRMSEHGFFISVFASFAGDIMLDIGIDGLLLWVLCFFLLTTLIIRRSHRDEFDISEVLVIFMLSVVPLFGIFYYRYHTFLGTFAMLLVLGVFFVSLKKKKE